MRTNYRWVIAVAVVIAWGGSITGCSRPPADEQSIVAWVNDEPVFAKDLKQEISYKAQFDPNFTITPDTLEEQLRIMIDRRLLIQEARKRQLDEQDQFARTIKTFWEQTLIRDLITAQENELEKDIEISDDDLHAYYDNLGYHVTFAFIRKPHPRFLEPLLNVENKVIPWDSVQGPVSYDEVAPTVFGQIFQIPAGEREIIQGDEFYYLVWVKRKEKVHIPPFKQLIREIERKLVVVKLQKKIHAWIEAVKTHADVTVNNDLLKGVDYDRKK